MRTEPITYSLEMAPRLSIEVKQTGGGGFILLKPSPRYSKDFQAVGNSLELMVGSSRKVTTGEHVPSGPRPTAQPSLKSRSGPLLAFSRFAMNSSGGVSNFISRKRASSCASSFSTVGIVILATDKPLQRVKKKSPMWQVDNPNRSSPCSAIVHLPDQILAEVLAAPM